MVYAQDINPTTLPTIFPAARFSNIGPLLNIVLPIMMAFAAIVFLIMALYGGFMYLTNGNNPEGIKKAFATMVSAAVGLIIVISSFTAVKLIGALLKVNNILP